MNAAMLLFFAVVACALTAGAPPRPSFPSSYQATFASTVSISPGTNITSSGILATSKALEASMRNTTFLSSSSHSLILFKQHVFYSWGSSLCIKKAFPATYRTAGDPLQDIQLTTFAGLVRVRNLPTQEWLYQSPEGKRVAIYVTDDALQTPVRLSLVFTGSPDGLGLLAEQIDYLSFTAGASPSLFQPPTCTPGSQLQQQRLNLPELAGSPHTALTVLHATTFGP